MPVDFIDFSCKHDILIKNKDGSYLPMDEPYFESELIAPDTWRVLSSGDYCYLVKGDGVAFAVDCGYGAGNIRKYMESVAGVPVPCVVNTHDHFDHTASNAYFDKAYMSKVSLTYATVPFASFKGIDFHPDEYERVCVKEGDIIPLTGRELEVIGISDHAPSSLIYLDRTGRVLFTGDEFFGFPMKGLNFGLKSWCEGMQKIKNVWDDFDIACGGNGVMTKEHIKGFIDVAEYAYANPDAGEGPNQGGERRGGGPRPLPDYEGHMVYDRMLPHAGDRGAYDPSIEIKARPENMRTVVLNGFRLMYDVTLRDE